MKVTVTDLLTSAKHYSLPKLNFHGFDLEKKDGYTWQGRINHHTPEELEKGRKINPCLQIVAAEELYEAMGVEKHNDHGKTAVFWLVKGSGLGMGSLYFKFISIPAFVSGVEGSYVEVELDD